MVKSRSVERPGSPVGYIVIPYQIDLADGSTHSINSRTTIPYLPYFIVVALLMSWHSSSRLRTERLLGQQANDVERIFDPFFINNPEGLGLGLSISRTIIEAHGGTLWATQNEHKGATIHFQPSPSIIPE